MIRLTAALLLGGCLPHVNVSDVPPCGDGYHECDGCPPRCVADGVACDDPRLEIGAGDPNADAPVFVPFDARGTLALHTFGQGFYHAFVEVRTAAFGAGPVELTRVLCAPATHGDIRDPAVERVDLVRDPDRFDGSRILDPSRQIFAVCPSVRPGEAAFDRDLLLDVTMAPVAGESALHRTAHVWPVCPDGDAACRSSSDHGCAAPRAADAGP